MTSCPPPAPGSHNSLLFLWMYMTRSPVVGLFHLALCLPNSSMFLQMAVCLPFLRPYNILLYTPMHVCFRVERFILERGIFIMMLSFKFKLTNSNPVCVGVWCDMIWWRKKLYVTNISGWLESLSKTFTVLSVGKLWSAFLPKCLLWAAQCSWAHLVHSPAQCS